MLPPTHKLPIAMVVWKGVGETRVPTDSQEFTFLITIDLDWVLIEVYASSLVPTTAQQVI